MVKSGEINKSDAVAADTVVADALVFFFLSNFKAASAKPENGRIGVGSRGRWRGVALRNENRVSHWVCKVR